MNTRIVYTDALTNNLHFLTIPWEMFDANSRTRQDLKAIGISFNSDDEVIAWVRQKDIPQGVTSYLVDQSKFPISSVNRANWYYDAETNSVRDS